MRESFRKGRITLILCDLFPGFDRAKSQSHIQLLKCALNLYRMDVAVQQNEIDAILSLIKVPLDHPLFYPRIFALAAKHRRTRFIPKTDVLFNLIAEEFEELSRRLDRSQIQESCSVRNVLRSRRLAQLLIDKTGDIHTSLLPPAISYLKNHLCSLGPQRQYDTIRQEHTLSVLQLLHSRKDLVVLLKKFTRPITNKWAEELIRQALQLPTTTVITDAHTRQAVLSAWLCYLRQNVGSCFATAPAEIIHNEQPELFLQDLLDLLATGSLKRTFGGVENSVPLSASWGGGDLKKPILIQQSTKATTPEIWYSPGLLAAFEATGFLNTKDRLKEKIEQLEKWIQPVLAEKRRSFPLVVTAEEILRKLLMQFFGITDKQLKEYENRSKGMVLPQLLIQTTKTRTNTDSPNARCEKFLHSFETAKNVFKSFADNPLLKAWEFTLASFSDIKYEFARWNFYASLGLENTQPGGIGQCIHRIIQEKLDEANRKVQEIQYEYEMVYTQVKTFEARMRHASTEKEIQWLKIEYQTHRNEFYFLEEQKNEAQHHAQALVDLYQTLYSLYIDLFKDYFQEIYDADMQEVTTSPFDDSPAGFRLVYKHGRSNTSQWTRIKNSEEFIDALAAFFVATEPQISHSLSEKKIERDLSDVVTAIINHIKTNEFLESALHRMAAAHRVPLIANPLEHLDKIEKKPWVYTSGGTMNTLVSCYYRIEEKPKEAEKWVESEIELLVFLADTLKNIPFSFMDPFIRETRSSMLMQSPTHAFLLKPMIPYFREMWATDEFTYTFIRDHFVQPSEIFVEKLLLTDEMLDYLVQQIYEKIPENYQPRFKIALGRLSGPLNPIFFREHISHLLETDRGLQYGYGSFPVLSSDEIDSFLYENLPLCPLQEIRSRIQQLLSLLPSMESNKMDQILQLLDRIPFSKGDRSFVGAQQLQNICKALLCLNEVSTTSAFDYHFHISLAAQKLGFSMPTPLIFADTNWVKDLFGFVVNPGTGKLQLWRLDYTGSKGYPMTSWDQWVNGSRSDLKWGVYIKPFQYGQS